jgi:gas vesicle protein
LHGPGRRRTGSGARKEITMKQLWTALGALTAGAAAMYLTDPAQGARRRARLRRLADEAADVAVEAVERAGQQVTDRLQDLAEEGQAAGRQVMHQAADLAEQGQAAGRHALQRAADWAEEGQAASRQLLHRAQALARARRDAWSARLEREPAPAGQRPDAGATLLTAASGMAVGIAVGAAAMFLLDPQQRRRRLALARDQARHLGHASTSFANAALRDLGHRAKGLAAQATSRIRRGTTDDVVLVQRVRAALGRVVSHPHAVWVTAGDGCVTVGGPVLADERAQLLRCVRSVHGVREVRDALEAHDSALRVPALQGGVPHSGPHAEFLQARWTPGPRLLALAGGTLLALYGASRRGLPGLVAGTAGLSLATRAVCNEGLRQTLGRVAHRREVTQDTGLERQPAAALGTGQPAVHEATPAQPWQPGAASPEPRGGAPLH